MERGLLLGGRWWWVDKRSLETKEPPGDDEVGEISKSKTETIRRRRGKRGAGKMYGILLIIPNLKKIIHIFTMKLFRKAKTQFHCLLSLVVSVSSPASPGDGLDIETTDRTNVHQAHPSHQHDPATIGEPSTRLPLIADHQISASFIFDNSPLKDVPPPTSHTPTSSHPRHPRPWSNAKPKSPQSANV